MRRHHACLLLCLLAQLCPAACFVAPGHHSTCAAPRGSRQPAVVCQYRGRGRGRGRGWQPPPKKDTTPINEDIAFEEMRVLVDVPGDSDELLGVMSKADAIEAARSRELDLVLIAAKSDPPVCKIVSYDKFRFNKEKKQKDLKKATKGQELKELKLSYKIGDHDFQVRERAAVKFLGQGHKIKFSIQFKGREIMHSDVGLAVMKRMETNLVDSGIGVVDSPAKVNGRQMIMTVLPKQYNKGEAGYVKPE